MANEIKVSISITAEKMVLNLQEANLLWMI